MRTPEKVSPRQLVNLVTAWLEEHCERNQGRKCWQCRNCHADIVTQDVAFSIHNAEFTSQCGGFGHVEIFGIPWCQFCEVEPPARNSCIHVKGAAARRMLARHRSCRSHVEAGAL